ncbi:hypothetical protein SAMN05446927_7685 [Caballeronia arationis]|uniref:Uncharacterized protein n=1 Tax=Caballeronia arationis TaxID=1777142 RepID=A0A7Z7IGT8_9BURK|nr:hypothetical protein SAMN05446927_7685 [Caballeronia arationis]
MKEHEHTLVLLHWLLASLTWFKRLVSGIQCPFPWALNFLERGQRTALSGNGDMPLRWLLSLSMNFDIL